MKSRKGFTLIKLLAVIIILGILMLIAIPSVTTYINNSRKETYVNTIQELIKGTVVKVNSGESDIFDTDTTYYIPTSAIKLENGDAQSPYGELDDAYVVVTYNGDDYDYYFVGKDEKNMGIEEITKGENITKDSIKEVGSVDKTVGIEGKSKIIVFDEDLKPGESKTALSSVSGVGSTSNSNSGDAGDNSNNICRRATVLHTATCTRTYGGCYSEGYYVGGSHNTTTITYGKLGTSGGPLSSGDALDCDVNGDGVYDSENERFYYVTSHKNSQNPKIAVLQYYGDVEQYRNSVMVSDRNSVAYDYEVNYYGPTEAYYQLPEKTQWSNEQIIAPGTRTIVNEDGESTTEDYEEEEGPYEIEPFTYDGKAARLLTVQEIMDSCGVDINYLWNGRSLATNCNYLMENVGIFESGTGLDGYWLETPYSSYIDSAWYVYGSSTNIQAVMAQDRVGVRPTIEVFESNISK